MRQLRLVGLNDDGSRLVLRDEAAKTDYLLPLDERLSAALRGDRARLGQLEITLESQLRPRDMQARVRAGESPAEVAKAAGLPLDRVMRFVAPVVAEREHIAEQALTAAVRRPGGDGPGPVLGATVLEKLASKGVAADDVTWDSWRRDDGRWTVQAHYSYEGRERTAEWAYDPGARAAHAVDDDARALSGVKPRPSDQPVAVDPQLAAAHGFAPDDDDPERAGRADTAPVGGPRLAAVRGEQSEIAVGDDAGADVGGEGDPSRGKARRAHVPSWDEIMFGRRRTRE
jgi:hypothetical protein